MNSIQKMIDLMENSGIVTGLEVYHDRPVVCCERVRGTLERTRTPPFLTIPTESSIGLQRDIPPYTSGRMDFSILDATEGELYEARTDTNSIFSLVPAATNVLAQRQMAQKRKGAFRKYNLCKHSG